ncbi:histidine phosphatase superfamily [Xylaria intraflava]|nr:histidine phosphatase superfamily [Xylaria intraflava]
MAPTIDIVRSAHAIEDNTGRVEVSSLGRDQCNQLSKNYPYRNQLKHIVSSPLTRSVQTGIYCFLPESTGFPMVLLPELQGTSTGPKDTGVPLSDLKTEFGNNIDTSSLSGEEWYYKGSDTVWFPSWLKVEERARQARLRLRELAQQLGDDDRIIVITHGFFANFLVQDFGGVTFNRPIGHWRHAQFRSFRFVDLQGQDDKARLEETQESLEGGADDATTGQRPLNEHKRAWHRAAAVDFLRRQEQGGLRLPEPFRSQE